MFRCNIFGHIDNWMAGERERSTKWSRKLLSFWCFDRKYCDARFSFFSAFTLLFTFQLDYQPWIMVRLPRQQPCIIGAGEQQKLGDNLDEFFMTTHKFVIELRQTLFTFRFVNSTLSDNRNRTQHNNGEILKKFWFWHGKWNLSKSIPCDKPSSWKFVANFFFCVSLRLLPGFTSPPHTLSLLLHFLERGLTVKKERKKQTKFQHDGIKSGKCVRVQNLKFSSIIPSQNSLSYA